MSATVPITMFAALDTRISRRTSPAATHTALSMLSWAIPAACCSTAVPEYGERLGQPNCRQIQAPDPLRDLSRHALSATDSHVVGVQLADRFGVGVDRPQQFAEIEGVASAGPRERGA